MSARLRLNVAARCVLAGGVLAYPTEAVYGLGCRPNNLAAVERIIAIKGRSAGKGLILIASSLDQILPYVSLPAGRRHADILASWPGPVTWVLPANHGVSHLLTGGRGTLAVRLTAHGEARYLCMRVGGPLVSTSANRSGHPPARTALEVRARLGREVDYVHVGPLGHSLAPTMIRDGATGKILRAG